MKDVHTKTFAIGLAALAAVGFSACSSNKSDSGQQTSCELGDQQCGPRDDGCACRSRVRPDRLWLR